LAYSETPHATIEVRATATVATVDQESRWRSIPGAAFHDLLRGPVRCRVTATWRISLFASRMTKKT
jgi:hypothetical protein